MSQKEQALELHRESLVVDTHCDTLKCLSPVFTRYKDSMREDRSQIGMGSRSDMGHVDLPRLQEGGVDCQVFAISSIRERTRPFALRTAIEMLDIFYSECDKNRNAIVPVISYGDVLEAAEGGKIAAMLSVEGADILEGSLGALRMFHRMGVRIVGLVHSLRNRLADGVADSRTRGGLSELGVEVVEELIRLGIVIDVSHLSDAGFWDLIEVVKGPFMATHSNSRAVCEHPRNMTDEMIEAMADREGVMGMNFAPAFVHPPVATVECVVDHIDHIVNLVGPDHARATPVGLEDVTKMPNITKELVRREYPVEDIRKILGENHLRVFKQVIG